MTEISLKIDDSLIDGLTVHRNSVHFDGKWEIFLSHKIGSVKDNFGRPIGKYCSGKGVDKNLYLAHTYAIAELELKVEQQLALQNASPPQPSAGLSTEEEDLFKLLDL
jgi:hypothetical protein